MNWTKVNARNMRAGDIVLHVVSDKNGDSVVSRHLAMYLGEDNRELTRGLSYRWFLVGGRVEVRRTGYDKVYYVVNKVNFDGRRR